MRGWILWIVWLFAFALVGCKSDCEAYCDVLVDCVPEDQAEHSPGSDSCHWRIAPDAMRDDCQEECDQTHNKLDDEARSEWEDCLNCLEEGLDGECRGDALSEVQSACTRYCDDDGVDKFEREFREDFDISEKLVCD